MILIASSENSNNKKSTARSQNIPSIYISKTKEGVKIEIRNKDA